MDGGTEQPVLLRRQQGAQRTSHSREVCRREIEQPKRGPLSWSERTLLCPLSTIGVEFYPPRAHAECFECFVFLLDLSVAAPPFTLVFE